MENKQPLFREEAINSRLNRSMGTIRLNVPLNYRIVSVFSLIIIITILLFLSFAQISEKIFVRGFLDNERGIVTVHSDLGGVILQSRIEEGDRIIKGDTLFVIANGEHVKTKGLIDNLNHRIKNLRREYQLKKDHYKSISTLYEKRYISASTLQSTESELLEITNKIKLIDLELIKYKQSQYQLIKSPIDGIITNIFYKTGQSVERSKILVHIIPENSKLIARLYIPSQDIGFLNKGKVVSIKYDAYPAQRFGVYKASIKEINLTVLTDDKEDKPIKIGQPYYKVKAELEIPHINLYGKKANLSHGMTFTAVVNGDKKNIWRWILDPIYSYYGDTFT
jgi:membrane fusion protein